MHKTKLYGVYAVRRGTSYSKCCFAGTRSQCVEWRSQQPKPDRGTRLVICKSSLMNR